MAQDNGRIVARSRLLPNNSAAEFIETRPGGCLGTDFSTLSVAEFAPGLDKFINRKDAEELKIEQYYEASKRKSDELEALLIDFAKLINDRHLDRKFDVQIKSPKAYKMTDVLEIAEKIQKKHQASSKVKDWTGMFRTCFDSVGRNQGTLSNLLEFIPSDSYGSIICGGFTLVLTAIERANKLRDDIMTSLAEIPRKLELIKSLTDFHRSSIDIYQAGDTVLVALFKVLERIINELTKSTGRKVIGLISKGNSYAADVGIAIKCLEDGLVAFKERVLICNSQRLGEICDSQYRLEIGQARLETAFLGAQEQLLARQASMAALQPSSIESTEDHQGTVREIKRDIAHEERLLVILNQLYKLLTSSPRFDAHTGFCIPAISQPASKNNPRELNGKIINDWLKTLPLQFHDMAIQDMNSVLDNANLLSFEDQGKVQYIMASTDILDWLAVKSSRLILVQSEAAPEELVNPLSFCSAFLVQILRKICPFPVLYYNSGYRASESFNREELSGPLALLNTLNAELASHLLRSHGDTVDLSSLPDKSCWEKSTKNRRKAIRKSGRLFKCLIEQLPQSDTIYIVIDGLSRIAGEDEFIDQVSQIILRRVSRSTRTVKVLLTDILSRNILEGSQYYEIVVPTHIDFEGQGLNLQFLYEDTQNSPIT